MILCTPISATSIKYQAPQFLLPQCHAPWYLLSHKTMHPNLTPIVPSTLMSASLTSAKSSLPISAPVPHLYSCTPICSCIPSIFLHPISAPEPQSQLLHPISAPAPQPLPLQYFTPRFLYLPHLWSLKSRPHRRTTPSSRLACFHAASQALILLSHGTGVVSVPGAHTDTSMGYTAATQLNMRGLESPPR